MFSFSLHVKGQTPKSFSEDSVAFINELREYFKQIVIKENLALANQTLDSFSELWFGNRFDHRQKHEIYSIANLMIKNRLKAFPAMEVFLSNLNKFKLSDHNTLSFNNWLASARLMLESSRNSRKFNDYNEFTNGLLSRKTLYSSKIFTWKINTENYRFNADTAFSLTVTDVNLKCASRYDSSTILNTRGTFFPLSGGWIGQGGKITWWRTGLSTDSVFAFIGNYKISIRSSQFEADSVVFYNKKFFKEALIGKLTEKVSTNAFDPDNVSYPQFESYVENLFIPELFRDIDYYGGFSMKGNTMIGTSLHDNLAQIVFKRPYKDKSGKYDVLVARSGAFIIENDRINSSKAAVSIFHQEDSIFHSGLYFKYMDKNREISMLRTEDGNMQSPYFDNFHGLYIDCEAVYWKMDEPFISFKSIIGMQQLSTATFISDKFYFEEHFDKLQGLNTKHPLLLISGFLKKYNTSEFYVYELARFMNYPESQIEAMVINLAKQGFLYYDVAKKKAVIGSKLQHYIDAKNKKTDYDVIAFISNVENKNNATLSLDNFDLAIGGVPDVLLSDSQKVFLQPSREEVILRKNKDFLFSGKVDAGLFNFMATDCSFEYDTFRLNLPTIEYMKFKVKSFEPGFDGKHSLVEVRTVVSDISGDLLVDFPTNKSGLKNYPSYPVFNSKTESFVYYDVKDSYKEAYNRERFKYYLRPFKIEDLENFSTDNLQFFGELNSGGIFPEISQPLRVQDDYSLGFKTKTPANGYPVYGGKGTFISDISLSNNGLRGKGTLQYLNCTLLSNDFVFFLDSANSVAENLTIREIAGQEVEYPSASGKNLDQHWLPYQDLMYLETRDSLVRMFDNQARFRGKLLMAPSGLLGDGILEFYDARLTANKISFASNSFKSDTTQLKLNALDEAGVAFLTNIYKADVDFTKKLGHFETNGAGSTIEFPLNDFNCYMDEFDWFLNENRIELRNTLDIHIPDLHSISNNDLIDLDLTGSDFVSTHPGQDSLQFFSVKANYDLNTNILQAMDVQIVKVADAAIFPNDGLIEIDKNAVIKPLSNATIIADTLNRNHVIKEADVNIISKHSYTAKGNYSFKNAVDEVQVIHFEDIKVDTSGKTLAFGTILPDQNFTFSPQFAFKGNAALTASEPFLEFDGAFRIIQDCSDIFSRWVKFNSPVDPKNIVLPVPEVIEEFGAKKLYAGFFHSMEENRVYPAFFSRKSYYSDTLMMGVNGWLSPKNNGTKLLIASPDETGLPDNTVLTEPNILFSSADCKITLSGPVNFGADFGQVSVISTGRIDHYIIPDSTIFKLFMVIDFYFANEALLSMKDNLNEINAKSLDLTNPVYSLGLSSFVGKEAAGRMLSEINLFGSLKKSPEELIKSFVLADVVLSYNKPTRSFVSRGQIGVAMILGEPVNKYFDGYIELIRRRSGDVINVYIETDRKNWYYFRYGSKMMEAISSSADFNKFITEVKTEKRKDKEDSLEEGYRFQASNVQRKNNFLRSMKSLNNNEGEE